jgi:hypothetical protein
MSDTLDTAQRVCVSAFRLVSQRTRIRNDESGNNIRAYSSLKRLPQSQPHVGLSDPSQHFARPFTQPQTP